MKGMRAKVLVEQRLDELIIATQRVLGVRMKRPVVDYDLRGFAAGGASMVGNRMSLNPVFLYENPEEFIDQTVGHEYNHLLVYRTIGLVRYNHGKEWQGYMKALGVKIRIDHSYDVSTIIGKERKPPPTTMTFADDDDIAMMYQRCKSHPLQ